MEQGLKLLGTPLGHPEYVSEQLERLATEHQTLLDRIPVVPDLQCAWAILLHCASARANYVIRAVRPEQSLRFARSPVVKDSCTLLWCWEDWDSAALQELVSPRSGRVGKMLHMIHQ